MVMILHFLLASLFASSPTAIGAHSKVTFISQTQELVRDKNNYLAFYFEIDKDWHIYWKNPGDSGKEPRIKWLNDADLKLGDIEWPSPSRLPLETLMNYGYEGKIALPFKVFVPKNFSAEQVELKASLTWLVCKVECIPAKGEVRLELNVADSSSASTDYVKIQEALNRVPLTEEYLLVDFNVGSHIEINFDFTNYAIPEFDNAYFFSADELTVEHAVPQKFVFKDGILSMTLAKYIELDSNIDQLSGVLELSPKDKSLPLITFEINAQKKQEGLSLLLSLFFAFIGGMILNLMPCVFPVLSLKVLSFVHQAKDNPKSIRNHGWYYTLGVLIAFWILTLGLVALKASGEAVGWGFQLQSPYFVSAMMFLFFFIGLNLLGFFEVGESLSAVGSKKMRKEGYFSSLQTGVLAAIVATPCTAPFMGVAIGTAFTQPAIITFTIFTALALGMAFPYILLSYFPQWLRILPKPGLWMKKLKELLAFPMLLTSLWLLWVLQQQTSDMYIFISLLAMLSILFLFWFHTYYKKAKIFLLILGAFILATTFIQIPRTSGVKEVVSNAIWQNYSEQDLSRALNNDTAVFIDFTAKWCITCQVNKRMVLNTEEVQTFFKQNEILLMQADWTNADPAITKKLAEFGRNSVPLYIYYPPGSKDAKVLPEILTKDMILEL